jgi:hypothetical protein
LAPTASKLSPGGVVQALAMRRNRDPIGYLALDMADLTKLLDELKTRDPTQPDQQLVVGRLDEIIKLLERASSGNGGANPNPTRPMADSKIAKGPGGAGPMHDPKSGTRAWGQLPPKQREQILQSTNEGFPPGYESILSSYYKRLAQEEVTNSSSSNSSSTPATQPAGAR